MGYRGYGPWGLGNGAQGVWGTWAMGAQGYGVQGVWAMGYRGMGPMGNGAQGVWGTRGMGHMGNESDGQWGTGVWGIWVMRPTGGMGYRGMGYMGNRGTGYGVQGVWTTWTMGNGIQGYGTHGERGPMGNLLPKYQKDVKLSKRCQVVKKMSSCEKNVKCQKIKHLDYAGGSQKN